MMTLAVRCHWIAKHDPKERGDTFLIDVEEWVRLDRAYQEVGKAKPRPTPQPQLFGWDAAQAALHDLRSQYLRYDLPIYTTSFIGREEERSAALAELGPRGLVTLWGSPGCGKSRLATEVANQARVDFPDGAWWVDLANVRDETSLLGEIAVGARLNPQQVVDVNGLVHLLRPQRVLLVLDNCERQTELIRPVVEALSAGCPSTRLLITTRKALGVEGEHLLRIEPFARPDPTTNLDTLRATHSVQMFRARMPASARERLDNDDLRAIAAICWELEGIPLAIEIVAPCAGRVPLQHLRERLKHELLDLRHPSGQRDSRHETLRAAIAWSVQEVTEDDRACLRVAALFPAGSDVTAIATVQERPAAEVERAMHRLIENSLVETVSDDRGPTTRIRLLHPIRDFALSELFTPEEIRSARVLQGVWCSSFLRSLPDFMGPDQVTWRRLLDREYDNIREVLHAAIEQGDASRAYSIAGGLWRFFDMSGRWAEGLAELNQLISLSDKPAVEDRVEVVRGLGVLTRYNGDVRGSREMLEEAVALSRTTGNALLTARSLGELANTVRDLDDPEGALGVIREARSFYEQAGDAMGATRMDLSIGTSLLVLGRYEEGTRLLADSLPLIAEDRRNRSAVLNNLAIGYLALGQFDAAVATCRQALAATEQWGDSRGSVITSISLAMALGWSGQEAEARIVIRRALRDLAVLRFPQQLVRAIEVLAGEAARGGAAARAMILASAAAIRRPSHPDAAPLPIRDRYMAELAMARKPLTESDSKAWQQIGSALTDNEVVRLGLAGADQDVHGVLSSSRKRTPPSTT